MGIERREAARKHFPVLVRYSSPSMDLQGACANVSRTGLFMPSVYLDDPGVIAALEIDLPDQRHPVRVAGKVVRVQTSSLGAGMGIHFADLSEQSRKRLARFVSDSDPLTLA